MPYSTGDCRTFIRIERCVAVRTERRVISYPFATGWTAPPSSRSRCATRAACVRCFLYRVSTSRPIWILFGFLQISTIECLARYRVHQCFTSVRKYTHFLSPYDSTVDKTRHTAECDTAFSEIGTKKTNPPRSQRSVGTRCFSMAMSVGLAFISRSVLPLGGLTRIEDMKKPLFMSQTRP